MSEIEKHSKKPEAANGSVEKQQHHAKLLEVANTTESSSASGKTTAHHDGKASTEKATLDNLDTAKLYAKDTIGTASDATKDPRVSEQRDHLNEQAKKAIFGPMEESYKNDYLKEGLSPKEAERRAHKDAVAEYQKLLKDEDKFEQRSKQLEAMYCAEGLSESDAKHQAHEQIAQTYFQIGRLLSEHSSVPSMGIYNQTMLSEQILHQAADPTTIEQHPHSTCGQATAIELRCYTRDPSKAAAFVASLALKGEYISPRGGHVKLEDESILPHGEATNQPPGKGDRSYASQIFQVAAINMYYQANHKPYVYKQTDPTDDNPSGDQLWDMSPPTPKIIGHEPMQGPAKADTLVETANLITNRADYAVIDEDGLHEEKNGKIQTTEVKSAEAMGELLKFKLEHGLFPVCVGVYTGNEDFPDTAPYGHAIAVIGYSPGPPAMVTIDNTGPGHQGSSTMPLSDLYHDMYPPPKKLDQSGE